MVFTYYNVFTKWCQKYNTHRNAINYRIFKFLTHFHKQTLKQNDETLYNLFSSHRFDWISSGKYNNSKRIFSISMCTVISKFVIFRHIQRLNPVNSKKWKMFSKKPLNFTKHLTPSKIERSIDWLKPSTDFQWIACLIPISME